MQEGAGPPFQNPPSARDVRGASPPHEIRTPPPRFRGDPGCGASLRVWMRRLAISGRGTHTPGGAESHDHLGLVRVHAMLETALIKEGCVG